MEQNTVTTQNDLPSGVTLHNGIDTNKLSSNLLPLAFGFSKYPLESVKVFAYYNDQTMQQLTVNAEELRRLINDPKVYSIIGLSTTKY